MKLFRDELRYLAEGGQETELMYGHGFDLPQFALFPLLDNPAAVDKLTEMYSEVLGIAEKHGMGALLGGLDYRASPDWAGVLGFDDETLAHYQLRAIDFLRTVSAPYRSRVADILICGIVGPQGDDYERNQGVTRASAEAYHSKQMSNLANAGFDLVQVMTLTSADEAIGVTLAARAANLPIVVSLMPDPQAYVDGSESLRETICRVDEATGAYPLFYGLNCFHPHEFGPLIEQGGDWVKRIGLLRPNASSKDKVELCQVGHLERGDPQELAKLWAILLASCRR